MSASPIISLRKAIRVRLVGDAAIVGALGGPKVFDEAPRNADPPYILFTDTRMRDWSTRDSRGAEQFLTLSVVTTQRGLGAALGVSQTIADILDEASLALEGHSLVDLRFMSMDAKRDQSGRFASVAILFRATTEFL